MCLALPPTARIVFHDACSFANVVGEVVAHAQGTGETEDERKTAPANSSGAGAGAGAGCSAAAATAAATAAAAAAAHMQSVRPHVHLAALAAIVAREPAAEPQLRRRPSHSVFLIEHVRNTAARVLSASVCTPAGILLSALLKVGAKPNHELDGALLCAVQAYVTTTAPDSWKTEPTQTHARDALGVASTLTNKRIRNWRRHEGELTLECLQVGPIVRRPLEAVFKKLHWYVVCVFVV